MTDTVSNTTISALVVVTILVTIVGTLFFLDTASELVLIFPGLNEKIGTAYLDIEQSLEIPKQAVPQYSSVSLDVL